MNASLLSDITTRLTSISDTPALDASVLLAHAIGRSRTWILSHPELILRAEQQKQLNNLLARLESGEPLAYVIRHWEFYGLDFNLTPDVLIPRPETELLVEKAIAWLNEHHEQDSSMHNIADIGTGSGAIAIAIANNVPDAKTLATDISSKALAVARQNAKKHGVDDRVNFVECDLLPAKTKIENQKSKIDLLCANLPYIPTKTLHSLPIFGHEPTLALDGGADGLDMIRRLMNIVPDWLAPNALMLFEFESTLGKPILNLAHEHFPDAQIQLHQDLSGLDRLLEIQT